MGFQAAIEYLESIGMNKIEEIEKELLAYDLERMSKLDYVTVYGPKNINNRSSIISFAIDGVHPHDVASIFDSLGVAIRSGNHCAQPLMRYMNINATCRASFYFYNTKEDVDRLIKAIEKTYNMFLKCR